MPVGDEIEGAISSLSINSVEIKRSTGAPSDLLSQDDVAWADSCLVKDPELSENVWNSWNSLIDVLSETLSSEYAYSGARIEDSHQASGVEISPSVPHLGTSQILDAEMNGVSPVIERADDITIDERINGNSDICWSAMELKKVFRPTYNENFGNLGNSDATEDGGFPVIGMEQSTGDVFKVWDLGIPAEEDELIKQLQKALAESSLERSPLVSDDFGLWKGLKDISIDDIVSGMADLSLNQFST